MVNELSHEAEKKAGFVLIAGAGLGSWLWADLVPLLSVDSVSVDLPGRARDADLRDQTLEVDAQHVAEVARAQRFERVVVVGHSAGGGVALRAASLLEDAGVVLVGAGVPPAGHSYADALPFMSRTLVKVVAALSPRGLRAPDGAIRKALCNDLTAEQTETVLKHVLPEATSMFTEPVHWTMPHPCTYIRLLRDASDLTPALQEKMAARLGPSARVETLDSGHLPMLSQPRALAAILEATLD